MSRAMTYQRSYASEYRQAGLLGILDALGHRWRIPGRVFRPVCDRYDARLLGMSVGEMRAKDRKIGRAHV